MSLQNRVTPFGEIVAVPARGTMMGNRGGRFHRDDRTLGRRRWASHHWICCELHYKGMHHEPMGQGYTSLFFLDEVTALAAGHRPCFFCRRTEAKRFMALAGMRTVEEMDRVLHGQRLVLAPRQRGEERGPSRSDGKGEGQTDIVDPRGNREAPHLPQCVALGPPSSPLCEGRRQS